MQKKRTVHINKHNDARLGKSSHVSHLTSHRAAFTLAEILVTLGIIGVIAAMTIPNLIQSAQERQWVSGLLKFNTNLQQAIQLWKNDIGCNSDAMTCIGYENIPDNDLSAFEKTFGKYMKISDKASNPNTKDWLPDDTANYYGDFVSSVVYGKTAHKGNSNVVYLLQDGTTLSMDFTSPGYAMYVDVNGKKNPNRIGKDVFPITVGFWHGKDVYYQPYYRSEQRHNTLGLCQMESMPCTDPSNVDPSVGNGANPTAYVILNHKIPDYKALAEKYPGTFKP